MFAPVDAPVLISVSANLLTNLLSELLIRSLKAFEPIKSLAFFPKAPPSAPDSIAAA